MEQLVGYLPYVKIFLDDLLILAEDSNMLWSRIDTVLDILQKAGVRLKKEKCYFDVKKLPYLGLVVSREG